MAADMAWSSAWSAKSERMPVTRLRSHTPARSAIAVTSATPCRCWRKAVPTLSAVRARDCASAASNSPAATIVINSGLRSISPARNGLLACARVMASATRVMILTLIFSADIIPSEIGRECRELPLRYRRAHSGHQHLVIMQIMLRHQHRAQYLA